MPYPPKNVDENSSNWSLTKDDTKNLKYLSSHYIKLFKTVSCFPVVSTSPLSL